MPFCGQPTIEPKPLEGMSLSDGRPLVVVGKWLDWVRRGFIIGHAILCGSCVAVARERLVDLDPSLCGKSGDQVFA